MKLLTITVSIVVLGIVVFRFLQPKETITTNRADRSEPSKVSFASERQAPGEIEVPMGPIPNLNLAGKEQIAEITDSVRLSSNNLAIGSAQSRNEALPLEDSDESARSALDAELPKLRAETYVKPCWTNAGYQTIAALISSYYSAMQMGNFEDWLECFSPKEKRMWQSSSRGRELYLITLFRASLDGAQGFLFISAVPFEKSEYLITLEMTHAGGVARERFVVLRVNDGWRISNESGELQHEYHASRINAYDLKHR